ncbi:MAG: hypothetical protein P4M11_09015 [Candidatus Pacebacteria bacterium]|nr:hypothetical protein [Candidatus Paceibacterota bacterium]
MSKLLLLLGLVLPAIVFAEIHYFHYKDGKLEVNGETYPSTTGVIYHTDKYNGDVEIYGTSWKGDKPAVYEFLLMDIQGEWSNGIYEASASCTQISWQGMKYSGADGSIKIRGTWDEMNYSGRCNISMVSLDISLAVRSQNAQCPQYRRGRCESSVARGKLANQCCFGPRLLHLQLHLNKVQVHGLRHQV